MLRLVPADILETVHASHAATHGLEVRATMLPEDPAKFRRRASTRIWTTRALYVVALVALAGLVSWGAASPERAPSSPAAALAP